MKQIDYTLYLCTDRDIMKSDSLEGAVERALAGGCTVVQLREKNCSSLEFYNLAVRIKKITDGYDVPLIINDRIDICLAADADGVHLGQSDIPCAAARRIMGGGKIIGVSAAHVEEAVKAESDGADYLGVGAVFSTSTKKDTRPVEIGTLKEIRDKVGIPIVAIGGINKENIKSLYGCGLDGAAAVSAILGKEDITAAAKEMKELAVLLK